MQLHLNLPLFSRLLPSFGHFLVLFADGFLHELPDQRPLRRRREVSEVRKQVRGRLNDVDVSKAFGEDGADCCLDGSRGHGGHGLNGGGYEARAARRTGAIADVTEVRLSAGTGVSNAKGLRRGHL